MVLSKIGSTTLQDRSSICFTLTVAFLPTGIAAISGICPDRQELLPTASAGVGSTFSTLFKAFTQIQHLVTAGLEAAIFAVSGLGVDDFMMKRLQTTFLRHILLHMVINILFIIRLKNISQ